MPSKRVKPAAMVILNMEQAEEVLGKIAHLKRRISATNMEMNAAIDTIKQTADAQINATQEELEKLEAALAAFANYVKPDQFEEKRSAELLYGTIGFRRTSEIKQATKTTVAMVVGYINTEIRRVRDSEDQDQDELKRLTDALRVKVEYNKEVMRGWSDEQLAAIGLRRVETDAFYYEIKEEVLKGAE